MLEDLASGEIDDTPAGPDTMSASAAPRPALPATQPRRLDLLQQVETLLHRNPVGR